MAGPFPNAQNLPGGAIPVYVTSGGGDEGVTPKAALTYTVTTGGVAVAFADGPINGGFIINPLTAAAQGISNAENLYIDCVNTPGDTDATGNNTTTILQPGQSFTLFALATGSNWQMNAASSGHKVTIVLW